MEGGGGGITPLPVRRPATSKRSLSTNVVPDSGPAEAPMIGSVSVCGTNAPAVSTGIGGVGRPLDLPELGRVAMARTVCRGWRAISRFGSALAVRRLEPSMGFFCGVHGRGPEVAFQK